MQQLALWLDRYFRLNLRIRDEKTRGHYRYALANLKQVVGREPELDDLSDDNVTLVMSDLLARGRSARTANERRDRLNALWTWLARRGVVKTFPTNQPVVEPERVPVAWTREELQRVIHAADQEKIIIGGVPGPLWWRTLHLVAWDSSERISALLACCWHHLQADWLTIPAEARKGKRRDMTYQLHAETIIELSKIRQPEREKIWPWPYHRLYLWNRFRTIRKRAGLPDDRNSSFHRMRKSVASHFEASGGNATELLGHSSRKVTRLYLDPRIVKHSQPIDLLFRPDSPEKRPNDNTDDPKTNPNPKE